MSFIEGLLMWPVAALAAVQAGVYAAPLAGVITAYFVAGQRFPWQAQSLQDFAVPYVAGGAGFLAVASIPDASVY